MTRKMLIGVPSTRPYSPALVAGPFVFVSGQVAIDRTTGKVVGSGVDAQTTQVLDNLEALLREAGLGLDDVVKTTVFLTDIKDFAAMNEVYRSRFAQPLPTRSTVEVSALANLELKVEIEAIALRREDQ
jgi:2-iminobutanoate/2-iminopropanoate deaminase